MKAWKTLTRNDIGATGSHQAGILIPKDARVLELFPQLNPQRANPRAAVIVLEVGNQTRWVFNFIYYNNRKRGGTRDEYRLTGMTQYLREINAQEGDALAFTKDCAGVLWVALERKDKPPTSSTGRLVLNRGWKIESH